MSFRRSVARVALFAALVCPCFAHAAGTCTTSVASLHGWFGMVVTGGNLAAGSAKYQTGAVLFDGAGGVSGSNIYGAAGSHGSVTGSYVENADCTLTIALTVGSALSTYTVTVNSAGEAVGIEVDASAVANIAFKPQYATYTPGLNFTASSLNGKFAAACIGPLSGSSDLNLVTFDNGSLSGTDPYNNSGTLQTSNVPYSGSYTINSDGTFKGTLTVTGTTFDFYGVLATEGKDLAYIYEDVSDGAPIDAFAACSGGVAL